MQNLQKISRCLISVSDKSQIIELAKFLADRKIEIISTGGTAKLLTKNQIPNIDISEFSGFEEIMDGRVKTLHPKVHGALLGVLDNENHQAQAKKNDIQPIDLLIVNLYPFVETINKTDNEEEIIENIDIGGPAMLRSAAKNFAYKTIISDIDDYQKLITEIKKNDHLNLGAVTNLDFRRQMASKIFKIIADYDVAISNWFINPKSSHEIFPQNLCLNANLKQHLRYGENAHQKAAFYQLEGQNYGIGSAKQIQGKELSYNNLNDADAAYNLAIEFSKPVAVIIKHANPCGVAIADNHFEAYKKAFLSDSKSAFGGIVAINGIINEDLALEISKTFYEVIIAKEILQKAAEILSSKKNLRILLADFAKHPEQQIKSISGGILIQELDQKIITKNDIKQAGEIKINDDEIEQLIFAMQVCKYVKSNAIVIANNFQTAAIGAGQTSRVDSTLIACNKASNYIKDQAKKDLYLASDAFFPFDDSIKIAHDHQIKAIIAPSGSVKDEEIIAAANKNKIALYFLNSRHFRH
jgi:phosphoribosylaminoimidazolecarboxamide formyltransferase/IMP cyclohydrolase